VYMATAFRRYHNCTIGEYVRRLRIEYSCRELAGSNRPLAEIAASAGYADQSHFCRAFRNSTGLSPAQYRRLYLN
ncbi:MAG TPA: helix-turn-helix transcriptional regulator, partial [Blastocatellia bacterium]